MNFTFRNNIWKGEATNSVIPTNSRPFTNSDTNLKGLNRTANKANPIKHWRKQLFPRYPTKSSKQVSISMLEAPTSVVYKGSDVHECSSNNMQLLKENITLLNNCAGTKYVYDDENNKTRCIGGSHNIRRSGNTNISKGYYKNYSKYLQAKCKTYEQNQTLGSQNTDGSYAGAKCNSDTVGCDKPIIYKPSNSAFSQQGSVSASANILRKKNNAITNNSASLKTAYGNSYVNVKPYYPGSTGYEIKYIKGDNTNTQLCNQTFKTCNTSG